MEKPWLTKKCSCGASISYNANKCRSCSKKGNLNPSKRKEVRDKISKSMKSPEKRAQVMKWQKAGTKAVKELSLERFLKGNPSLKISKKGYLMIYIPELAECNFKKGWMYYHHYFYCNFYHVAEIKKGFCIHHKDRNKLNNLIDNLQLMTIKEHDEIPKKLKRTNPSN